jgi:hypothetical protein
MCQIIQALSAGAREVEDARHELIRAFRAEGWL